MAIGREREGRLKKAKAIGLNVDVICHSKRATGIGRIGADGRNAATLGGWQLAVSKYSKNQKLAAELVTYLTSSSVQKMRAINGSDNLS